MERLLNVLFNLTLFPGGILVLLVLIPGLWVFRFLYKTFVKKEMRVAGKTVIITGASSGIGESLAFEYAQRGANLVLTARRENLLQKNAEKCRQLGSPDVLVVPADLTKVENNKKVVDQAVEHFGGVDIVVCNAGKGHSWFFEAVEDTSEFQKIADIDFWGNVYPTYYAMPHLKRAGGQIVVIDSVGGFIPYPRQSLYNAQKQGLLGLYDTLRVEAADEIDITIACPGYIRTAMTEKLPVEQLGPFPLLPVKVAARRIVEAAVRRDRYVIVPGWYKLFLLYRIFAPEVMDWTNRYIIQGEHHRPALLGQIKQWLGYKVVD
ncbi:short chain dehydrogenase reductase [Klebsormidium nitens]|uniref:Short chain dehydrogenase reductase n=1 Tax=Klebsormidium nitens TaxID=105231 RepID=A0A0U9HUK7_KLENI|nr:short chain dehydrogenase reductase [Klebsormidium nitens]|eukprot:GAQ81980.1 short chain dehydrogenase reductase [Klebsormidium nitens]